MPGQFRVLAGKESLPLSQRHDSRPRGKNPPRVVMNHESSGCPLPPAQANKPRTFSPPHSNTTHMPTSWQGIPTSSVPPGKWKRRFHWTHSWGMGTTRELVTAGTSGIPPVRKREDWTPTWRRSQARMMPTPTAPTLTPRPHCLLRARLQNQLAESMPRNSCHRGTTSVLCTCLVPTVSKGASR